MEAWPTSSRSQSRRLRHVELRMSGQCCGRNAGGARARSRITQGSAETRPALRSQSAEAAEKVTVRASGVGPARACRIGTIIHAPVGISPGARGGRAGGGKLVRGGRGFALFRYTRTNRTRLCKVAFSGHCRKNFNHDRRREGGSHEAKRRHKATKMFYTQGGQGRDFISGFVPILIP